MQNISTYKKVLIYKLSKYLNLDGLDPPRVPNDTMERIIRDTIEEQESVGWDNFVKGQLVKVWGKAQAEF
eukprot:11426041-Ditylum_brightwellii.AAC.1